MKQQKFTITSDLSVLGESYSPKDAAKYLNHVKESTLATWRSNDPQRLPFHRTGKKGGRVRYFKKHLDEFLTGNMYGV